MSKEFQLLLFISLISCGQKKISNSVAQLSYICGLSAQEESSHPYLVKVFSASGQEVRSEELRATAGQIVGSKGCLSLGAEQQEVLITRPNYGESQHLTVEGETFQTVYLQKFVDHTPAVSCESGVYTNRDDVLFPISLDGQDPHSLYFKYQITHGGELVVHEGTVIAPPSVPVLSHGLEDGRYQWEMLLQKTYNLFGSEDELPLKSCELVVDREASTVAIMGNRPENFVKEPGSLIEFEASPSQAPNRLLYCFSNSGSDCEMQESASFIVQVPPSGDYQLSYQVRDLAGNSSEIHYQAVKVRDINKIDLIKKMAQNVELYKMNSEDFSATIESLKAVKLAETLTPQEKPLVSAVLQEALTEAYIGNHVYHRIDKATLKGVVRNSVIYTAFDKPSNQQKLFSWNAQSRQSQVLDEKYKDFQECSGRLVKFLDGILHILNLNDLNETRIDFGDPNAYFYQISKDCEQSIIGSDVSGKREYFHWNHNTKTKLKLETLDRPFLLSDTEIILKKDQGYAKLDLLTGISEVLNSIKTGEKITRVDEGNFVVVQGERIPGNVLKHKFRILNSQFLEKVVPIEAHSFEIQNNHLYFTARGMTHVLDKEGNTFTYFEIRRDISINKSSIFYETQDSIAILDKTRNYTDKIYQFPVGFNMYTMDASDQVLAFDGNGSILIYNLPKRGPSYRYVSPLTLLTSLISQDGEKVYFTELGVDDKTLNFNILNLNDSSIEVFPVGELTIESFGYLTQSELLDVYESESESFAVLAGPYGTLKIFDLKTKTFTQTLQMGLDKQFYSLDIHKSGRYILVANLGGEVKIFDRMTEQEYYFFEDIQQYQEAARVRFFSNGILLGQGSSTSLRYLPITDFSTMTRGIERLITQGSGTANLRVSNSGDKLLVSTSNRGEVLLMDRSFATLGNYQNNVDNFPAVISAIEFADCSSKVFLGGNHLFQKIDLSQNEVLTHIKSKHITYPKYFHNTEKYLLLGEQTKISLIPNQIETFVEELCDYIRPHLKQASYLSTEDRAVCD